jgi:G3E family GTPase
MRNVASMGLRDVKYTAGPFITLIDGPEFEDNWEKRRALILGQLADADVVAVSRTDLIDSSRVQQISGILSDYAKKVIHLSVIKNYGIEEVLQTLGFASQDIG